MKSIEERAKEYADRLKDAEIGGFGVATVYSYKDVYNANMAAYKRGATEQREIDMIQVRQFLEREIAYNGSMSYVDDLLIEELCKAIEE